MGSNGLKKQLKVLKSLLGSQFENTTRPKGAIGHGRESLEAGGRAVGGAWLSFSVLFSPDRPILGIVSYSGWVLQPQLEGSGYALTDTPLADSKSSQSNDED